jgi:hypothetical protein
MLVKLEFSYERDQDNNLIVALGKSTVGPCYKHFTTINNTALQWNTELGNANRSYPNLTFLLQGWSVPEWSSLQHSTLVRLLTLPANEGPGGKSQVGINTPVYNTVDNYRRKGF